MSLELVLLNQLLTLCAQLGYAFAFRGAFERQARVLRSRYWACFALGLAICFVWLALGYGAFYAASIGTNTSALVILTVPLYLALAAGGAVSLAALSSKVFGWRVEDKPFLCIFAGQVVALAAGALPKLGPVITALYACSGIGAVALSELTGPPEDEEEPRLGLAGLGGMLVLTAALSLALWRAGAIVSSEADPRATGGATWSSSSQR